MASSTDRNATIGTILGTLAKDAIDYYEAHPKRDLYLRITKGKSPYNNNLITLDFKLDCRTNLGGADGLFGSSALTSPNNSVIYAMYVSLYVSSNTGYGVLNTVAFQSNAVSLGTASTVVMGSSSADFKVEIIAK